ncbi:YncE family protein [Verrucosispora sp. NA02020]|uniref:YncE family protein n=1 Tax=Verrucosispora sp. NA02020 TaxID=2742132 RepID=UPI003D764E6E
MRGRTAASPGGRDVTPVLIADAGGARQRLRLPGTVVPEAFTHDHSVLYVLEWLPPQAPDRYRVRVVDLATGVAGPLQTRLKQTILAGAEEEMRGDMAIAPDGSRLYVADLTSGTVAEISTEELTVRRTAAVPVASGPAYAVADDDRLFLGGAGVVRTVDAVSLRVVAERPVDAPVSGLLLGPDSGRLYVGGREALRWLDPASGAELGRVAVPGLVGLRGPVPSS